MNRRSLVLCGLMLIAAPVWCAEAPEINAALREAAMKGELTKVKDLIAKGAKVNDATEFGATALVFACDRGHLEVVRTLLEHGADVNHKDTTYQSTPITWAAYGGHAPVVALLLARGATDAAETLEAGIERGHLDVVKAVLASGKVPKETLSLSLAAARQQGAAEAADLLVAAGATPLPKASSVMTPEQLAACAGVYRTETGRELALSVADGSLVAAGGPGGGTMELSPKGEGVFQLVGAGAVTLSFNMEGARVTGLTLKTPGAEIAYKKEVK